MNEEDLKKQTQIMRNFSIYPVNVYISDRKRMSVVVMDEGGLLWLFCKGAEVSLLPIVKSGSIAETIIHNTDFAMVTLLAFFYLC